MNLAMLLSLLRSVLLSLGGYLVGKGYFDTDTMNQIVAAIVAVVAAWGAYDKKDKGAKDDSSNQSGV